MNISKLIFFTAASTIGCAPDLALLKKTYSRPCIVVVRNGTLASARRIEICNIWDKHGSDTTHYIIMHTAEIAQEGKFVLRYEGTDTGYHYFVNMAMDKGGDESSIGLVALPEKSCEVAKRMPFLKSLNPEAEAKIGEQEVEVRNGKCIVLPKKIW